jgi:hypothetical protein
MSDDYIIEKTDYGYIVTDPTGDTAVFSTEQAARADIERAKKDDAMLAYARTMLDLGVEKHMQTFGVERARAVFWIKSAADLMD